MTEGPDISGHKPEVAKEERFMALFLKSERRILGFILALVPNLVDAEDLLQETCTIMWRKFDEFMPGTDFTAWGIAIARYRVLNFRRTKQMSKVCFSESLMLKIADASVSLSSQQDRRADALQACLSRLSEKEREIIRLRYFEEHTGKQVAQYMGTSMDAIFKSLNRVHDRLLRCIRSSLATEGLRP